MSDLVIYNHVIQPNIKEILQLAQKESRMNRIPNIENVKNGNIRVLCPFHDDNNPSAFIYATNEGDVTFGTFHCFSCGYKTQLWSYINQVFGTHSQAEFGKQWLVDNFSNVFLEREIELPEIVLPGDKPKKQYMNECVLEQYRYIHPYLLNRGIGEEVIKEFEVGWNPNTNCVTFPVRDEHGGLVGITERSVETKRFFYSRRY